MSTDSADSDSDRGKRPTLKKKRSTRTLRLSDGEDDKEVAPSCTYSKQVTSCFKTFSQYDKMKSVIEISKESSDVEDDMDTLLATKKRKRKLKSKKESPPSSPIHITALDDDDDLEFMGDSQESNTSLPRDRSPTPPNTPKHLEFRKRKRRPKAVSTAVKNLEMVGHNLKRKSLNETVTDGDCSIILEDEERQHMVKVRSRSGIQRFPIGQNENFEKVMQDMSRHEFVPVDRIVMFLNDVTIQPFDTPASLNLHIADIIECHVKKEGDDEEEEEENLLPDDPNRISVQVQGEDAKSKIVISVARDEPLEKLMRDYAYRRSVSLNSLTFQFDGEGISRSNTPDDLDMEDDDCIDVIG